MLAVHRCREIVVPRRRLLRRLRLGTDGGLAQVDGLDAAGSEVAARLEPAPPELGEESCATQRGGGGSKDPALSNERAAIGVAQLIEIAREQAGDCFSAGQGVEEATPGRVEFGRAELDPCARRAAVASESPLIAPSGMHGGDVAGAGGMRVGLDLQAADAQGRNRQGEGEGGGRGDTGSDAAIGTGTRIDEDGGERLGLDLGKATGLIDHGNERSGVPATSGPGELSGDPALNTKGDAGSGADGIDRKFH